MFELLVKSGLANGASWAIGEYPLLIGRSTACDVCIPDPSVSRRHCEIYAVGHAIQLRDLGSINRPIVNGQPVTDCTLRVGDEICIGRASFLVAATDAGLDEERSEYGQPFSTVSLAEEDSSYLSAGMASRVLEDVSTAEELAELFSVSRALSRSSSLQALQHKLADVLKRRFGPDCCWLVLVRGDHEEAIRLLDEPCPINMSELPAAIIAAVLEQKRGGLFPNYAGNACILAAPICMGEHEIGVLGVARRSPNAPYTERDVDFLVALANVIAPFFRAFERMAELEVENERLRIADAKFTDIVGSSKAMKALRETIKTIAPSLQAVLILGETGTGKELVAGLIHELSGRTRGPLVTVNCAAIPRELFESELFGHEKGAFTGAISRKTGLMEQSHGGTLFLDEIGDLSLDNQGRILRAVEMGRFRRVGGVRELEADLRVVAATNKDLQVEMRHGRFREDLYHRLRAIEVRIPPLRDRGYDIAELAQHFLANCAARLNVREQHFSPDAIEFLLQQKWSGNVRELKNTVQVAATVCRSQCIQANDLRTVVSLGHDSSVPMPLEEVEKAHIVRTLDYCSGKVLEAAKLLGISKSSLYNKLSQYGLR